MAIFDLANGKSLMIELPVPVRGGDFANSQFENLNYGEVLEKNVPCVGVFYETREQ